MSTAFIIFLVWLSIGAFMVANGAFLKPNWVGTFALIWLFGGAVGWITLIIWKIIIIILS